jgi:hypothetical protein
MKKKKQSGTAEQMDLSGVTPASIRDRHSKVRVEDFARVVEPSQWFARIEEALPRILAGNTFRQVVDHILTAVRTGKPVIFMLGAHVIKCGLSGLIVDLMQRGVITAVALNGAGAIHDVEIAVWGQTSEDVAEGLADGRFGMTGETADLINGALARSRDDEGYGRCLGRHLSAMNPDHVHLSLLAAGFRHSVPVTVHVALGTDVIHQHPSTDGALVGELSFRDFKILAGLISRIGGGGVVANAGSAVILPEVFLKCLSLARNVHGEIRGFTTVNLDMIRHYRPTVNLIERPSRLGGRGYELTGHHELIIPLLTAAIRFGLEKEVSGEEKTA